MVQPLHCVANTDTSQNISIPAGGMWDSHHYQEPTFFLESFNFWDNWQQETGNEDVTVLIGEYSVFQIDTPSGVVNYSRPDDIHLRFPTMLSAIGEGVYLLGAERNPNVVKMTAYAPSLQNLNHNNWDPDLVQFTANHNETVLSASWQLESLFAHYRGTETLPVTTVSGEYNPLWWAAQIDETQNCIYFKVINSGNSSTPLTINADVNISAANGTILVSSEDASRRLG